MFQKYNRWLFISLVEKTHHAVQIILVNMMHLQLKVIQIMDDFLKSVISVTICQEIIQVMKRGGFNSNSIVIQIVFQRNYETTNKKSNSVFRS